MAVAAGARHTCALASDSGSDGSLGCWGDNTYGQLGVGSTIQHNSPVAVSLGAGKGIG